jgi:hypothetical protein
MNEVMNLLHIAGKSLGGVKILREGRGVNILRREISEKKWERVRWRVSREAGLTQRARRAQRKTN